MKIILHSLLFSLSINLIAQTSEKIQILNANNSYANSEIHPEYWRLIGDVSFKHNDAIMYCDSAYHYINNDKVKAFGNIKINQGDTLTITGENLTYFGPESKINISGNVILIDKYMILKTNHIFYNLVSNIALYPNIGEIFENEKTIKSKKGKYNSNTHFFYFSDSVSVNAQDYNIYTDNMNYDANKEITYFFGPTFINSESKSIYCENGWYNTKTDISQFRKNSYITINDQVLKGDSLYYNKNIGYANAINNVQVIDTSQNIIVYGDFAEYFEEKKIIEITKKPLLLMISENDTLFLHAKKFVSNQNDTSKRIYAYNNVKFFKEDFKGKCDSLSYDFTDSILTMFTLPIIWINEFQITADSLFFILKKGDLREIHLSSSPFITFQDDSLDYNQIQGKKMTAYFNENKISKIDVYGNGQTIFFLSEDNTSKKIGLNYTECSNLSLYFNKNKLTKINYEKKPSSIIIPYHDISFEERFLEGFVWRNSEQPKVKEDIFTE